MTHTLRTPALMVQGTCSNAGKSLLTAALCRILWRKGFKVLPFKAQNMALNSAVTPDGLEIGRAQALQAAACHVLPQAVMNPVLLKPSSDTGSQVIVMGRPVRHMRVAEYTVYKKEVWPVVCEAYSQLAQQADIVILEGAGSPAEINLKADDIVNMRMAAHASAPVLLVADIDRGGAFASLLGTMNLLDDWEKKLVAGFILNKFRGDASLLAPALHEIHARTQCPFLGTVPWIPQLLLPEEDSVSFKSNLCQSLPKHTQCVHVGLIDTPHLSNISDIDALRHEPDVQVHRISTAGELTTQTFAALILGGSKNTLADLRFLQENGFAEYFDRYRHATPQLPMLIGICGGLQILGARVSDPLHVEEGGSRPALNLLPLHTSLAPQKTLRRSTACHCASGLEVYGYEIHHGHTHMESNTDQPCTVFLRAKNPSGDDTPALGWARPDQQVWGTYLHGIFDADQFRRTIINHWRNQQGLAPLDTVQNYSLEPALERLADVVEAALDMPFICECAGIPWR